MPDFILDHGSADAARTYADLSSFAQGYVEAMFFTDTGTADDGELRNATVSDLADETWATIVADCARFEAGAAALLAKAYEMTQANGLAYDAQAAGRDFWYSRNGHGVGYFDRGLGAVGDALQELARAARGVDLYQGDDEKLYLS